MNLTYELWYDKEGAELQEDIQDWIDACPTDNANVVPDFDMADVLMEEYEARVSDLEDKAYHDWKERDI